MGVQELVEELNRLLNEKCLIVLDDLSTNKEWDLVKSCLKNAGRVIVTTREKNIAEHCSGKDTNMYHLEGLKDAAALDLFKKKVFKDKAGKVNLALGMEEQAKLILKKCDGLPLAISTVGGFLATKPKTAVEWRKMHGRISAELEINPELRTIKKVLMRSYDGLPYHLKSCFLYMAIFPEDYVIKRKCLVRRWIAEGYCKEMQGMTAEEVGDTYFDELLERSMILPGEGVNHHSGKGDSCQLHDIIREICISKAREENLVFTLEDGCCLSSTQGTCIVELPTTIIKLRKLQHLITGFNSRLGKEDAIIELVCNWWSMYDISSGFQAEAGLFKRSCRYLQYKGGVAVKLYRRRSELGLNMHDLFNLSIFKHGAGSDVKAPKGSGKLTSLQTLGVVNVSSGKEKILKELTALTQLRKLGVTVHGDDIDGCLGGDLLPPKQLESLKLVGPLGKVPDWMHHLQSLSKLNLQDSKLDKAVDIETLGGLPNLAVLRLRFFAIDIDDLNFLGSSLLELYFVFMLNLLKFEKDAMPKLELLRTDKYLEMKGLQFLRNLKEIRMDGEYIDDMKTELQKQYLDHLLAIILS
ncbi:disease resistance protein Pik-2-like [Aegilops tauschii subsp. strangulata]|uniref:Disease resistance protein RPM1 n=1 Tax=Aegilops tauschii TaxID=37682 RepID=M8C4R7_AEGTA